MTNEEALAQIAAWDAEDKAADAAIESFKALGCAHASFAIDAINDPNASTTPSSLRARSHLDTVGELDG